MAQNQFECKECKAQYPKWLGRCSSCLTWSSLIEIESKTDITSNTSYRNKQNSSPPLSLEQIEIQKRSNYLSTDISELDRVLGGGIVPGSFVLLGGDPGVGKSTLLLQVLIQLGSKNVKSFYISGEESSEQIKLRSQRIANQTFQYPYILCETDLEKVLDYVTEAKCKIIVIDSIQTIYNSRLNGTPGAEQQLKETTFSLMSYAKRNKCTIFIIGHITKGGIIAGPKLIEHMVDTVIYFEGEKHNHYRILRSFKNRFGTTNEIGFFEMTQKGLTPIGSPSHLFLQNIKQDNVGTAMSCCLQGTRPILIEIQALVNQNSSGSIQRVVTGLESKRLIIILALIQKFTDIFIGGNDVFLSVAGGLKVDDPATDLAIALAIVSNFLGKKVPSQTLIIGELGLNGQVRPVPQLALRIKEAFNMNFKHIIIPETSKAPKKISKGTITIVKNLQEAIEVLNG